MTASLPELIAFVEQQFQEAAKIERMMPDRDKRMLDAHSGWPPYVYDQDDRKDQEPEFRKCRPSAKQIDLYDKVCGWLRLLGMRNDKRTVFGKKIIWARANGASYRTINAISKIPPMTCHRWYNQDIAIIARRINL